MKFLQQMMKRVEEPFKKEGKLSRLYPIFEMVDTFLYTPDTLTDKSPHIRDSIDLKRTMFIVFIALLPTTLFGIFNIGFQEDPTRHWMVNIGIGAQTFIPILLVSYIAGGFWEVLFSVIRKHEINEGYFITGLLIPLIVPPTIPLWMVAVAASFAVVIGKEIFGGTGYNIFNPALVGRAFLFFAYPGKMSGDEVWTIVDGVSSATPLAVAASEKGKQAVDLIMQSGYSFSNLFFGFVPGSIGETSTIAILIGAVILVMTKVANWRIIIGVMLGMVGMTLITNSLADISLNPMVTMPLHYHMVIGGFAFGMVFMATEPVTGAHTEIGRWIYGILIGFLVVMIRSLNPAFPEGMMLAILLGNSFAPLIDYYVVRAHINKRRKKFA